MVSLPVVEVMIVVLVIVLVLILVLVLVLSHSCCPPQVTELIAQQHCVCWRSPDDPPPLWYQASGMIMVYDPYCGKPDDPPPWYQAPGTMVSGTIMVYDPCCGKPDAPPLVSGAWHNHGVLPERVSK